MSRVGGDSSRTVKIQDYNRKEDLTVLILKASVPKLDAL
jgi:hypothetical protein